MADNQMRNFIDITDDLLAFYMENNKQPEMIVESVTETTVENPLLNECHELVGKLRSFMADSYGENALGVEMGMQLAADMISNMIKRFEKGEESFES